ncbi:hypothetical protein ACR6C2_15010 [Streptomyces sp. INA 01156]
MTSGFEVLHASPPVGRTVTPCCGTALRELPRYHGVTPDLRKVTCRSPRRALLRELVATVLSQVKATPAGEGPRLPHDLHGRIWDRRCALCVGDVDALADAVALTEVLDASTDQPKPPPPHRGPAAHRQAQREAVTDDRDAELRQILAVIVDLDRGEDPLAWSELLPRRSRCTAKESLREQHLPPPVRRPSRPDPLLPPRPLTGPVAATKASPGPGERVSWMDTALGAVSHEAAETDAAGRVIRPEDDRPPLPAPGGGRPVRPPSAPVRTVRPARTPTGGGRTGGRGGGRHTDGRPPRRGRAGCGASCVSGCFSLGRADL